MFLLNAENCLLKWLPKKKEMKEIWEFEVCFFSPSHLLYTPKSSKYIQGHIDHEFSLYTLWGKRYLTYKMIDYGDCKATWLQQFPGALLFPSILTVCVTAAVVGFCYFSLYIFSLFLFFTEFNYSYCSWTVELKNHLLSCIFTRHLIHAQLFISATLFRLGSEIFTKQRKQFHLLKSHKGRIINWLQCQLFSSIY